MYKNLFSSFWYYLTVFPVTFFRRLLHSTPPPHGRRRRGSTGRLHLTPPPRRSRQPVRSSHMIKYICAREKGLRSRTTPDLIQELALWRHMFAGGIGQSIKDWTCERGLSAYGYWIMDLDDWRIDHDYDQTFDTEAELQAAYIEWVHSWEKWDPVHSPILGAHVIAVDSKERLTHAQLEGQALSLPVHLHVRVAFIFLLATTQRLGSTLTKTCRTFPRRRRSPATAST